MENNMVESMMKKIGATNKATILGQARWEQLVNDVIANEFGLILPTNEFNDFMIHLENNCITKVSKVIETFEFLNSDEY